jgi:HlyD family secretion protein
LPEDVKKAELDVSTAKESLDANQKLYDSRESLFKEGALPRKDLDQAAVSLVQARSQFQIAEQHLASMRAVSKEQTVKSATGQLTSAQGKYQAASAQLSYTEIRSPINGVVTDRPVYPGETIAPSVALITIMDTSSVVAKAHIPEDQAALLKVGDAATIQAAGGDPVNAKVVVVSPATDPNSTTVEVWIEARNPGGALRPGVTVQVAMVGRTVQDAIVVPTTAILKTPEGGTTVMAVGSDGRAHETQVETGIQSGDLMQVTKGLKPGDTVVATGAYGLPDKTKVKSESVPSASDSKSAPAEKE